MTTPSYKSIRNTRIDLLLEDLEDPFASFPVGGATGSIETAINETNEAFQARMGPDGVARKYWDVPTELLDEEIGVLLGTGFLLGQTVLNQALSILTHIRPLEGLEALLPKTKTQLFQMAVCLDERSGLSHLEIIDHAANYFKHHDAWTEDWSCDNKKSLEYLTIQGCKQMGMSPGSVTDNLCRSLTALGGQNLEVGQIQKAAWAWRERLAKVLYARLGLVSPYADNVSESTTSLARERPTPSMP